MSPLLTQTQTQLTHPSFTLELNIYNRESRVQYKLGGTALNAITSGDLEHRFHACILSLFGYRPVCSVNLQHFDKLTQKTGIVYGLTDELSEIKNIN